MMMAEKVISVARDFSRYPGGRWRKDGPHSGQEFREDVLTPALTEAAHDPAIKVVVDIDGAAGYGSSFLEEAFGGIVREKVLEPAVLAKKLEIKSADPVFAGFRADAIRYFKDAITAAKH
jgi:hypothetical protein